jgi:hypothetical protein
MKEIITVRMAATSSPFMNEEDNYESNVSYTGNKEVYYSDIVGSNIRDAITGARVPWNVGSTNERRFFKVMSNTAYSNPHAKGALGCSGKSARQAFYETPHSYMKHHSVMLDDAVVKAWHDKIDRLYPGEYNYHTA